MSKESALEKYTIRKQAVDAHIKANEALFDTHQNLVLSLVDAENELRDSVAEAGAGVSNNSFDVTIVPQTMRVYNEDKMHQYMSTTQFADVVNDVKRPARISIKQKQ